MKIRATKPFYRHGYARVLEGQELDLPREEALGAVHQNKAELIDDGEEKAEAAPPKRPTKKTTRVRRPKPHTPDS